MLSISLGKYSFSSSLIHRLDARFKLFAMIVLMVIVFIPMQTTFMDFTVYGVLFIFIFIIMGIAKIRFISLLKMLKPMTFMMLFLLVINLFVIRYGNPLKIFSLVIYDEALYLTLYTFLRITLMLSFSLILTSTTKPMDLTYAFEWFFHPLSYIKFPVHVIAMIMSLALRFIPTLLEETEIIMKAQASRGVDFKNGHLKEKIKAIISLFIPLLASSLQKSFDLAEAMEVRGYNPDGKRTRYRVMKFHYQDLLSLLFIVVLLVGVILISIFKINFYGVL